MRLLGRQWIVLGALVRCRTAAVSAEQVSEHHASQADTAIAQEPAAREARRMLSTMAMVLAVHLLIAHCLVMVSSRFNSTRATQVQAANSVGVEPVGTLGGALGTSLAAVAACCALLSAMAD